MFSAFTNCLKIPELRDRILFTLGLVFVARLGTSIPLPGLNPKPLQAFYESMSAGAGGVVGMYNMFTGGALLNGAVFALGIMPYISASIIMQLMGAVVPSLARLQQEGEIGRQKIAQYTRYFTILICLVQGTLISTALVKYPQQLIQGYNPEQFGSIIIIDPFWFILTSVVFLTAGSMILMWLGEQITLRGVGNGVSLLITVGILAEIPQAGATLMRMFDRAVGAEGVSLGLPHAFFMVALLVLVIAGVTAVTQAQRKIPVQYAKRVVGRKVMGGQSSFLPLKVNYAGVMPVIFASAILMFPGMILQSLSGATNYRFFGELAAMMSHTSWFYYVVFGTLILGFSYFWVSIMFKPIQIADDLKKNNGYIPGVRPGEPTARFLDFVMTRLTLAGAIFLTVIAVFPNLLSASLNIPWSVSQFFGGTGTLIAVGVMLDTMRQIETHLLQRHYDGFLRKGRIRGRSAVSRGLPMEAGELRHLGVLWLPLGFLLLFGLAAWALLTYYYT